MILDEAALRRMRGGLSVMRSQLRRLLNESEQGHIRMQVLPLAVDPGPAYVGQFQLIEVGSPTILEAILADHFTGQWILEGSDDIIQYRQKFEELSASALDETSSRDLILRIVSDL